MSNNKFKYYTVNQIAVVRANSKSDAERLAHTTTGRSRTAPGSVLAQSANVTRVSADEARGAAEELA